MPRSQTVETRAGNSRRLCMRVWAAMTQSQPSSMILLRVWLPTNGSKNSSPDLATIQRSVCGNTSSISSARLRVVLVFTPDGKCGPLTKDLGLPKPTGTQPPNIWWPRWTSTRSPRPRKTICWRLWARRRKTSSKSRKQSKPAASANRIAARQKWIGPPLVTDGGIGPVPGQYFDIVAERQDLIEQRVHQLLARAAGQISPANRAGKQTVADENLFFLRLEQHHVSRRMSGTMDHFEG